jgi:hypothetical protein
MSADIWESQTDDGNRAPDSRGGARLLDDVVPTVAPAASPILVGRPALEVTWASGIKPQRVKWLWTDRIPQGALALLAGREGLGKSTIALDLAAKITRGDLPGEHLGTPRAVLVCATEDSWAHTIVPRLIGAGADLDRVARIEMVQNVAGTAVHSVLSLPRDLDALRATARSTGAVLLILDPLMSRLGDLDTHKDSEVRRALEPLVAIADEVGMAVIGLIHHNKGSSADPLQLVMASKAFTAVARSVHTVVLDPDDETEQRRLFGTSKNNLGRSDLPTLTYAMTGFGVATDDGEAWTGRVVWGEDAKGTIADALRGAEDGRAGGSSATEAGEWLTDYLEQQGGPVASADIYGAGQHAGHTKDALKRARQRLRIPVKSAGYPRRTFWGHDAGSAPAGVPAGHEQLVHQSEQVPGGDSLTTPTTPTVEFIEVYGDQSAQSAQSAQLAHPPALAAPTGGSPAARSPRGALNAPRPVPGCAECQRRSAFNSGPCPAHQDNQTGPVIWAVPIAAGVLT